MPFGTLSSERDTNDLAATYSWLTVLSQYFKIKCHLSLGMYNIFKMLLWNVTLKSIIKLLITCAFFVVFNMLINAVWALSRLFATFLWQFSPKPFQVFSSHSFSVEGSCLRYTCFCWEKNDEKLLQHGWVTYSHLCPWSTLYSASNKSCDSNLSLPKPKTMGFKKRGKAVVEAGWVVLFVFLHVSE